MTMNAPVGPPIWTRDPPRAEIKKPAMTAVKMPACGAAPEAIPKAMASGSATIPTVIPAAKSEKNFRLLYSFKQSISLGRKWIFQIMHGLARHHPHQNHVVAPCESSIGDAI